VAREISGAGGGGRTGAGRASPGWVSLGPLERTVRTTRWVVALRSMHEPLGSSTSHRLIAPQLGRSVGVRHFTRAARARPPATGRGLSAAAATHFASNTPPEGGRPASPLLSARPTLEPSPSDRPRSPSAEVQDPQSERLRSGAGPASMALSLAPLTSATVDRPVEAFHGTSFQPPSPAATVPGAPEGRAVLASIGVSDGPSARALDRSIQPQINRPLTKNARLRRMISTQRLSKPPGIDGPERGSDRRGIDPTVSEGGIEPLGSSILRPLLGPWQRRLQVQARRSSGTTPALPVASLVRGRRDRLPRAWTPFAVAAPGATPPRGAGQRRLGGVPAHDRSTRGLATRSRSATEPSPPATEHSPPRTAPPPHPIQPNTSRVVARAPVAATTSVAQRMQAGPPASSGGAPSEQQLDELAARLFERIRARLKGELLIDRERAGLLTDLRGR
jgi:hypothetical protein